MKDTLFIIGFIIISIIGGFILVSGVQLFWTLVAELIGALWLPALIVGVLYLIYVNYTSKKQ